MSLLKFVYRSCKAVKSWFIKYYFLPKSKQHGQNIHFENRATFSNIEKLVLGNDISFGDNVFIDATGGVEIGDHVIFGQNVAIRSASHDYDLCDALPYGSGYKRGTVKIGNNVWVGMSVLILPGVTIGEGAVIGGGAVVTKDIPPLAVAIGNPARVIKYRNKENYIRLIKEGKYLSNIRGVPRRELNRLYKKASREIEKKIRVSGYVDTFGDFGIDKKFNASVLYYYALKNGLEFIEIENGYRVERKRS